MKEILKIVSSLIFKVFAVLFALWLLLRVISFWTWYLGTFGKAFFVSLVGIIFLAFLYFILDRY